MNSILINYGEKKINKKPVWIQRYRKLNLYLESEISKKKIGAVFSMVRLDSATNRCSVQSLYLNQVRINKPIFHKSNRWKLSHLTTLNRLIHWLNMLNHNLFLKIIYKLNGFRFRIHWWTHKINFINLIDKQNLKIPKKHFHSIYFHKFCS